jgi:hypothetical protein
MRANIERKNKKSPKKRRFLGDRTFKVWKKFVFGLGVYPAVRRRPIERTLVISSCLGSSCLRTSSGTSQLAQPRQQTLICR